MIVPVNIYPMWEICTVLDLDLQLEHLLVYLKYVNQKKFTAHGIKEGKGHNGP